jgi:hypothetical protein
MNKVVDFVMASLALAWILVFSGSYVSQSEQQHQIYCLLRPKVDSVANKSAFSEQGAITACFIMRVKMAFGSSLSSIDVDIMCRSD